MTPNEEAALEELVWEMTAPHTQEEIAERLGISKRTVQRIEVSALDKLRAFADPDWVTGVREPPTLGRKMNAMMPTTGRGGREEDFE